MLHHRKVDATWDEISAFATTAAAQQRRPITEVVAITPTMAADILKNNQDNRAITKSKVESYASDMLAGRFIGLNGETIKIAAGGELNDGQHRLMAILKSGVTLETLVTFGLERDSRMTLDQGKVKSPGDYLGMSGLKNSHKLAAIAHVIYCFENGKLPSAHGATEYLGGGNVTKSELLAFTSERLDKIQQATEATFGHMARSLATETRLAAAFYIINQASVASDDVAYFFDRLLDGAQIAADSPILICRNRLIAEKSSKRRVPVARFLEIVIKGWNYYRIGANGTRIQCTGTIPEIES